MSFLLTEFSNIMEILLLMSSLWPDDDVTRKNWHSAYGVTVRGQHMTVLMINIIDGHCAYSAS